MEKAVFLEGDLQEEVTGRAAAIAWKALAFKADPLAFNNSLGDDDMQRMGAGRDVTVGIDHRAGQGDGLPSARKGIRQGDDDFGVLILALHPKGVLAVVALPDHGRTRIQKNR